MTGPGDSWLVQHAWLGGEQLSHNVLIEAEDGIITAVETDVVRSDATRLAGIALPGLVNAHSHAFHRLLRGRTHQHGGDFWVWRDLMYETAAFLTPESYERIATSVFVEMAMAGITTVGEFHYLHHQPGGRPYEDPNEMGNALIRAARRAGIRISLLDGGYLTGGLSAEPLHPVQKRFSDRASEKWLERVESLRASYADARDVRIGLAPHSVRAVPEADLTHLAEHAPKGIPLHIHVSEQSAENQACLETKGTTPVGLLHRVGLLGPSTTAIHATHVTDDDINALGSSGTGVCYCATTERDLGDGLGPASELHRAGSVLSVGSDSNACIDLFEEVRGIELHDRVRLQRRGLFAPEELAAAATRNGCAALGFGGGEIVVGAPADFIVVAGETPRMVGGEDTLAAVIYAATAADIAHVFVSGARIVSGGHHPHWEESRRVLTDWAAG